MIQKISILLILFGLILTGWSGYEWWSQKSVATYNPEKAEAISVDWNETKQEAPSKKKRVSTSEDSRSIEPVNYDKGEQIGKLTIPKLGYLYPVFWGTDENTLTQGVGMYDTTFTTTPGQEGHTALAGHRDTVFDGLDKLGEGDRLYLTSDQVTYEYQIRKTWITDEKDRSVIVKKELPTLTLTTCYPFDFLGSAPDRYIIEASLIHTKAEGSN